MIKRKFKLLKNKINDKIEIIGAKSLLIAFIILIVTIITAFHIGGHIRQIENEVLIQKGQLITVETSKEYDLYIVTRENMINRVAYTTKELLNKEAPASKVQDYLINETDYISSVLGSETTGLYGYINGEFIDGAGWVPDSDFVPTERPWYIETMKSNQDIVFVEPYLDANTKTIMMTIAKRIEGDNIVALDISLDKIQNIVEKLSSTTTGSQAFILNSEGVVVVHSVEEELGKNYLTDETPYQNIANEILKNGATQFESKINGNSYLVYAEDLEGDWYSVSLINANIWNKPLQRTMMIFTLIFLTVIMLMVYIFLRISAKNRKLIQLHNKVIKEIERGDIFQELSETDRMTGLYDRISGRKKMEEILNSGKKGMFLELDIDKFKHINDTYGHQTGDTVILAVADAIKSSFRDEDITMRLGGDEFGVFAVGITNQEQGERIINRFFEKIEKLNFAKMKDEKIHLSVGATLCSKMVTFDKAYAYADEALYLSKKEEGNKTTFSRKMV